MMAHATISDLSKREKKLIRVERRLRPALIILALVNIIFLGVAGERLRYGLIPITISLPANFLLMHSHFTNNGLGAKLFVDAVFGAAFLVWIVFGNIFLKYNPGYTAYIVLGTWSSMFTMLMW